MQQTTFSNFAAFSKITNKAWYFMRIVCWQTILMKYHTKYFFSKIRKDVENFVVCCSGDWHCTKKFFQKYYQGVKQLGSRSRLTFCIFVQAFFVWWLFFKLTLQKILSEIISGCQIVWIQIRTHNFCLLGNLACFLLSAVLLFFFFKKIISGNENTVRVSNSLDPDQAWNSVPDLGPS